MAKPEILYKELSYALGGLFYKTQDTLGCYALEKQYADFFESLLKEAGIRYAREKLISRTGNDRNRLDFLIEDVLVVEIKAKPQLARADYYQVLRYLEFADLPLGIIVNFHQRYLRPKRIVNAKFFSKQ